MHSFLRPKLEHLPSSQEQRHDNHQPEKMDQGEVKPVRLWPIRGNGPEHSAILCGRKCRMIVSPAGGQCECSRAGYLTGKFAEFLIVAQSNSENLLLSSVLYIQFRSDRIAAVLHVELGPGLPFPARYSAT